jgi:uncharacterized protein involved in copper resistance
MATDLEQLRLAVPDNVVTRQVDGTTIVLDIDTGRSFSLDGTGSRAWALLSTTATAQAAYERLVDEYAADPAEIRADLETLIDVLTANRLLVTR